MFKHILIPTDGTDLSRKAVIYGVQRGSLSAGLDIWWLEKTKFWTLKDSYVETTGRMCTRCGAISWYGDTAKLAKLRIASPSKEAAEVEPTAEKPEP